LGGGELGWGVLICSNCWNWLYSVRLNHSSDSFCAVLLMRCSTTWKMMWCWPHLSLTDVSCSAE
jgi:hypothetical protein